MKPTFLSLRRFVRNIDSTQPRLIAALVKAGLRDPQTNTPTAKAQELGLVREMPLPPDQSFNGAPSYWKWNVAATMPLLAAIGFTEKKEVRHRAKQPTVGQCWRYFRDEDNWLRDYFTSAQETREWAEIFGTQPKPTTVRCEFQETLSAANRCLAEMTFENGVYSDAEMKDVLESFVVYAQELARNESAGHVSIGKKLTAKLLSHLRTFDRPAEIILGSRRYAQAKLKRPQVHSS